MKAACVVGAIVLLGIGLGPSREKPVSGGTLLLKDGSEKKVLRFRQPDMADSLVYEIEGNRTSTPLSEVSAIWVLGKRSLSLDVERHHWETFARARFQNGAEVESKMWIRQNSGSVDHMLKYAFFNPATGKTETSSIAMSEIKALFFDESIGTYRRCPNDGYLFPPDYIFCPYDKADLEWAPRHEMSFCECSACNVRYRTLFKYCGRCGKELTRR